MRFYLTNLCLLFCYLFFSCSSTFGQENYKTSAQVSSYSNKKFSGEAQSLGVCFDKNGVAYFANSSNVIAFDGSSWTKVVISNGRVKKVFSDNTGRVFFATEANFGYLTSNTLNEYKVEFLKSDLEDGFPKEIYQLNDILIFVYSNSIFFYKDNSIEKNELLNKVSHSFLVGNKLVIKNVNNELKYFFDKDLSNCIYCESDIIKSIDDIYQYENKLLIATRKGLMISNLDSICPKEWLLPSGKNKFEAIKEPYLIREDKYHNVIISDYNNGVFILNRDLEIISHITEEDELSNNIVHDIGFTPDGQLLLATDNGISKVDYLTFQKSSSINENIDEFIIINQNNVFTIGAEGVNAININENKFNSITKQETWGVTHVPIKNEYIVATSLNGLYRIDSTGTEQKVFLKGEFDNLWYNKAYPNLLFVANYPTGLTLLEHDGKDWNPLDTISLPFLISKFQLDANSNVFLGARAKGGALIPASYFTIKDKKEITLFEEELEDGVNEPFLYENKIYYISPKGILEYNEPNQKLELSERLELPNDALVPRLISTNEKGYLWIVMGSDESVHKEFYRYKNNQWKQRRLGAIEDNDIYDMKFLNGTAWVCGVDGLFQFPAEEPKQAKVEKYMNLNSVKFGDSTLYYGRYSENNSFTAKYNFEYTLPYQQSEFSVSYGLVTYSNHDEVKYSYQLEGFSNEWSEWSTDRKTKFTNLYEGNYTLSIKAKDAYGDVSKTVKIALTITPPWYRTWWAISLYIISFFVFAYFLLRWRTASLRKRQLELELTVRERTQEVVKEKEKVEEQKHLVDEKNKEISDSINYAERIQRSMLANRAELDEYLSDYFIFFKPKDVVSGDFYWASILADGKLALVNADSTGHGVPGAIMSMLNMNGLRESVVGLKLTEANQILDKTRSIIKTTLENDGSEEGGKDGMDCSLLKIDKSTNTLEFSAANNPVYIVRNKELIEYKGDKMPVGKHDRDNQMFTNHTLEVQKGDMVYTITDGMPDQFGGPKGKKYLYKRMKNLLIEISEKPTKDQEAILLKEFNDWMGAEEQVDDVCIIGIRV